MKKIKYSFLFLLIILFFGCKKESDNPVDNTSQSDPNQTTESNETYTVVSARTWSVVSNTTNDSGSISFYRDNSVLTFYGYNTGGTVAAALTGANTIILKFPVIVGDSWSESGISNGVTVSSRTVVEKDTAHVSVPAGSFICVLTVGTITAPQGYNNDNYVCEYRKYFAPGVGVVKVVDTWKKGSQTIGELQTYSIANPDPGDYFPLSIGSWWKFKWK